MCLREKIKMISKEFTYNFLIRVLPGMRRLRLSGLWNRLWRRGLHVFSGPVHTCIHGRRVVVNYGYTYPSNARYLRMLNAPLVVLAGISNMEVERRQNSLCGCWCGGR